jgi:hypothetical protein
MDDDVLNGMAVVVFQNSGWMDMIAESKYRECV